jgi:hypothetical protein
LAPVAPTAVNEGSTVRLVHPAVGAGHANRVAWEPASRLVQCSNRRRSRQLRHEGAAVHPAPAVGAAEANWGELEGVPENTTGGRSAAA